MTITRTLGPFQVTGVGLGCMPLSGFPPEKAWILDKREQAIAVIHAALDAGVTLLDTSDIYAPTWNTMGHNERLVGEALRSWSGSPQMKEQVVIATKGGITRAPGDDWFGVAGRCADEHYFYRAAEASAARLGVSTIKLYQHHRLHHHMPFEEQFENLLKLKEHGIVENLGLSNVTAEQLELAIKIGGAPAEGGIISVQNEWSPRYRHGEEVLDICAAHGIAFFPWSPLGGIGNKANMGTGAFHEFDELAHEKGVSVFALTIAWHLASSPVVIPIPGATRPESILDSLNGLALELANHELERLNRSLSSDLGPIHPEMLEQPPLRK